MNQVTQIYELGQPPHTTFTYDFNGNVTSKVSADGTVSLQYDYENRLTKITYPDHGWTEFVYDGLGRLLKGIEKNYLGTILGETHYVYDGLDMIAELSGSDTLIAAFTHGAGIDEPLTMRYNGMDYFYLKNHQGSVTELTNATGVNIKTYKYDAFGNIMQETGPTINRGFTYTSRQLHARSGLYYYRARWYSPDLGRFLTQDPIGLLEGGNLYTYVNGDPVNWIDPLGLAKCYYSISDHTLVCVSDDGKSTATIGPEGIFSGRREFGDDSYFSNEPQGPIRPGTYKMVPSNKYGGSWWLDEGRFRRLLYKLGLGRGGFFFHLGTRMHNC